MFWVLGGNERRDPLFLWVSGINFLSGALKTKSGRPVEDQPNRSVVMRILHASLPPRLRAVKEEDEGSFHHQQLDQIAESRSSKQNIYGGASHDKKQG